MVKDMEIYYEEYKGCRNCKYQPEPLQTCEWLKNQKTFYTICPMWELKESEVKMTKEQKDNLFVLLFVIGISLTFIFNHVNKILWTIGFIFIVVGGIGIFRK